MDAVKSLDPNEVRFFSGRSNRPLAEKIAQHLKVPLEETAFRRFTNDNLYVQLGASVRGRDVYIVQSFSQPVDNHILELLMMLDSARGAAAREIHAIIPYFSYARSDKKDAPRISITARLMADLLKTAGATHVMTMTLHSPQVQGFFSVPTDPLTARAMFAEYIRERGLNTPDSVVVSPDIGHARSGARFAAHLGIPVAAGVKTRISDTKVHIEGITGHQIEGVHRAIVYDDEIATGGTVIELCQLLVRNGIKEIIVVCTHGLFLNNALERITAIPEVEEIVTTDTVPISEDKKSPKLTIKTVGAVIGEAIRRNYLRESIGDLFAYWEDDHKPTNKPSQE